MKSNRLLEFVATINTPISQSDIRTPLLNALKLSPQTFEVYEISLGKLDQPTWEYVKQRLLQRTIKHPVRGWAQFYDTLAEVRGYCYLLDMRYTNVRFISEVNSRRTPDIEGTSPEGIDCVLESKSIGCSDDELKYILENNRRFGAKENLVAREVVQGMPQGLKSKLESTIVSAKGQLLNYLPQDNSIRRILYLTLQLDIHMLLNIQNYTEIINFLRKLTREETEIEITVDKLSSV